MMKIFERVEMLYNFELYEEVILLSELYHNAADKLPARNAALLNVMIADSYFFVERYLLSMKFFHYATQQYAQLTKPFSGKPFSEAEVRYRYHQCLVKEKKYEEALGVLAKIPAGVATPRIRYAMYQLIASRDSASTTAHNAAQHLCAILKACPHATGCATKILRAGFQYPMNIPKENVVCPDFLLLTQWLEAQKAMGTRDYKKAVAILSKVETTSYRVLVELGRAYKELGMKEEARAELAKARIFDMDQVDGMDLLAKLYSENRTYYKDLETLGLQLMLKNPSSVESLIAFGYLSRSLGADHLSKALHFAYQACTAAPVGARACNEAMLLKVLILQDLGKHEDALKHIQEGLRSDPKNFDLYELQMNMLFTGRKHSIRELRTVSNSCLTNLPGDRRALVYRAKVNLRMPSPDSKALLDTERILEPMMNEEPVYLDAVWTLLEHYEMTAKYEKAIALLNKLTDINNFPYYAMSKLNHKLGDFLAKSNQPDASYCYLTSALESGVGEESTQMRKLEGKMALSTQSELALCTPTPSSSTPIVPACPRLRAPRRLPSESPVLSTQGGSSSGLSGARASSSSETIDHDQFSSPAIISSLVTPSGLVDSATVQSFAVPGGGGALADSSIDAMDVDDSGSPRMDDDSVFTP